MTCDKCRRKLSRPPVQYGGMRLGPVCAGRLGYVPPAAEKRGKVAKRATVTHSQDDATPDMFEEVV